MHMLEITSIKYGIISDTWRVYLDDGDSLKLSFIFLHANVESSAYVHTCDYIP